MSCWASVEISTLLFASPHTTQKKRARQSPEEEAYGSGEVGVSRSESSEGQKWPPDRLMLRNFLSKCHPNKTRLCLCRLGTMFPCSAQKSFNPCPPLPISSLLPLLCSWNGWEALRIIEQVSRYFFANLHFGPLPYFRNRDFRSTLPPSHTLGIFYEEWYVYEARVLTCWD